MSDSVDLVIRNATIVDGTGKPGFNGDVTVAGERIAGVGKAVGRAARTVDGTGLVACPGFVDMHSHADFTVLVRPLAENLVLQGITTFLGGNCGVCPAPVGEPDSQVRQWGAPKVPVTWRTFGEWLDTVEREGIGINYAPLAGHNTIRTAVMGEDSRRCATPAEVEAMKVHVDEAMQAGAFGLSTFFDPSPGEYASPDEVIELLRVAKRYGGLYVPHTRHTQSQWPTSDPQEASYGVYHGPPEDVWVGTYRGYLEAFQHAKAASVPVNIAHMSSAFAIRQPHPDYLDAAAARATLEYVDQAVAEGVDVTFDVLPYASSIAAPRPIMGEFSRWTEQLGNGAFVDGLKSEALRAEIRKVRDDCRLKLGMVHTKADPYWAECFTILRCARPEWNGKVVHDLARATAKDPLDLLFDIIGEDPSARWYQHLDRRGTFPIISEFLKHPLAIVSTDTIGYSMDPPDDPDRLPAPIGFGMYPHYIATYVRAKGVLSLEEAVRKASYMPAQRLGLKDRGVLRPGAYADIVLFDLDRIDERSTFLDPVQPPEGIAHVIVNGQVITEGGAHLGVRAGRVLRRA